jgi:hypothetical protein
MLIVVIMGIALCDKSRPSDDNLLLKPSGYFFARILADVFCFREQRDIRQESAKEFDNNEGEEMAIYRLAGNQT